MTETMKKLMELKRREIEALTAIVAPARAAANQMMDAGMKSGAAPLQEALFKYDAVKQEINDFVASDPRNILLEMLEQIEKQGGGALR